METVVLGIESSCDETSASVCIDGRILSNVIATQRVHEQYGGVVPELASRAHQQHIVPVVQQALADAQVTMNQIEVVGFTQGPGLLGSLLVGSSFAKGLSLSLNKPLIPVHHMKAHILAHFIEDPRPTFPFLCLTVSGGHTQIVRVSDVDQMEVIGQTTDDAVGEAFDKAAKMLGLPYPGGPLIDTYAKDGNPDRFTFGKTEMPGLDFSFSGIKTGILYFLQKQVKEDPQFIASNIHDLCASIQKQLVDMLLDKMKRATKETGINEVAIAGGVSANSKLRSLVAETGAKEQWNVYIPAFEYCTDNAAMIAISAYYQWKKNPEGFTDLQVQSQPRIPFV